MLETQLWAVRGVLVVALAGVACEAIIKYPPMMINIERPPNNVILFQVASRQDVNNKPIHIACEAEGEPAPRYQWFKNGKEFDWQTDNRISQQPGRGTLVITSPRDEDNGSYQCFATNELGTATSKFVFVRKSELNSFRNQDPQTVEVNEGDPVALSCQPPDGYPKPSVYWMIQDVKGALRRINSSRITVDPEGTLWFSNVTRFDDSNNFTYVCSATSVFNNEYKLGSPVYLRVLQTGSTAVQTKNAPAEQFKSRRNTVILKGGTLQLWCIFSGTPLPEIRWKKSNSTHFPHERVDYENYGKTLVIYHVDFEDEGNYECEVNNGVGVAKSYSMNVEVQASPYFEVEPEAASKAEGETAVFHCKVSGKPPPIQNWSYNSLPISKAPHNERRIVEPERLIIFHLTKADTGNYGCNATNVHNRVYKDFYLNVLAGEESAAAVHSGVPGVQAGVGVLLWVSVLVATSLVLTSPTSPDSAAATAASARLQL